MKLGPFSGPAADQTAEDPGQPPTLHWVIGSGGQLGSAVMRQLKSNGSPCFTPDSPWRWERPPTLWSHVQQAVQQLRGQLRPHQSWQVIWAAGRGSMGSTEAELEGERVGFHSLLEAIHSAELPRQHRGSLVLASSAGGVYAGTASHLIDETTPVAPRAPYGHWKLEQERLTQQAVRTGLLDSAFVGRISTLYPAGTMEGTGRGLVAHIAHQLVRRQPIRIFVPLDTMRDYLAVDDAARMLLVGAQRLMVQRRRGGAAQQTCILASEEPVTISELLAIFRRLARRPPLVVTAISGPADLYSRCVRYRSRCWPDRRQLVSTQLVHGLAAELAAARRSLLGAGARTP